MSARRRKSGVARQKLRQEKIALKVHELRRAFGDVSRGDRCSIARYFTTCIDCGWGISPTQAIYTAQWVRRQTAGFYAHSTCPPPFSQSRFLDDDGLVDIFDDFVLGLQNCKMCSSRLAVFRQLVRDDTYYLTLRYVCRECVTEGVG